jgi:hypothetical protein
VKTVEKAKKMTSKYTKKLKTKKDNVIKKLLRDIKQQKPIAQILHGFIILEDK